LIIALVSGDNKGMVTKSVFIMSAVLFAAPALAQQPPQAQPPKPQASAEPTSTTASYVDWVLRCQKVGGAAVTRVCEVAQSLTVKGQNGPVAQIAIGRTSAKERLRADSCDAAQAYRFDAARDSWMMPPTVTR
jgi:invasion protein IalB